MSQESRLENKSYFSSCLKNFVIDLSLFINAHSYDINIIANKSVLGKYSKQSMK